MEHRIFLGCETALNDPVMVDTYRYTFAQTYRMYTMSESQCKEGEDDVSM